MAKYRNKNNTQLNDFRKKLIYKRNVSITTDKKTADIKFAIANLYASSPYISKKKKDKYIKEMGFELI